MKILFFKSFWRTHVIFWGHWYPCFGFLVTSPLEFKARVGSALFTFCRDKCNVHSQRSTSGTTLANILVAVVSQPHMHVQRWDFGSDPNGQSPWQKTCQLTAENGWLTDCDGWLWKYFILANTMPIWTQEYANCVGNLISASTKIGHIDLRKNQHWKHFSWHWYNLTSLANFEITTQHLAVHSVTLQHCISRFSTDRFSLYSVLF